jgi:cell division protein FtsI (penicillin-binding protein 3)
VNGTHGTAGFGGVAAAPVFKTVAQEALRVLDVPKDLPDAPAEKQAGAEKEAGAENDLSIAELADPEELGETPEAQPAPLVAAAGNGPQVPNFKGMSMRAVLAEASSRGLLVQVAGSGVARLQEPPAGAVLRPGERVLVRFAR